MNPLAISQLQFSKPQTSGKPISGQVSKQENDDRRGSGGLPPVAPGGSAERGGQTAASPPFLGLSGAKTKKPGRHLTIGLPKTAATYSPNWWVSTIGDGELNFSVRNGKRWILTAITTVVYYLREKTPEIVSPLQINFRVRFSLAIFPLGKSIGQLVQVS